MSDSETNPPGGDDPTDRQIDEEKLVQDYALALQKTLDAKRRNPENVQLDIDAELKAAITALSRWTKSEPKSSRVIELYRRIETQDSDPQDLSKIDPKRPSDD